VWHHAPLFLLAAIALHGLDPYRGARLALLVAVASAAQFLIWPWNADSTGWKRVVDAKVAYMSRTGLNQIDQRERIHSPGDFWRTTAHDDAP
jgi:hypothetical protein